MKRTAILSAIAVVLVATGPSAQNTAVGFKHGGPDWVSVPYDPALVPPSGLTLEAWITYDDGTLQATNAFPTIVRHGQSYRLRVNAGTAGNRTLRWVVATGSAISAGVNWTFAPGQLLQWTHVAATYDGAHIKLFINAVEVGRMPLTGRILANRTYFHVGAGAGSSTNRETWNGAIDELRLWPFARTAAELRSSMNLQLESVPGLVSTWNFESNLFDTSNALHGAAVGTVTYVASSPLTRYPISGGRNFGAATPSCPSQSGIAALPRIGNADFALVCTTAPATANGLVLTGFRERMTPLPVIGIDLWVDFNTFAISIASDGMGLTRAPLPIPNLSNLRGAQFFSQFVWIDPCGSLGLSVSDGVAVSVQQ